MKGIPRGRYTKEFREEAVRPVIEDKISCHEAGRRLSLAPSTLVTWVKAYKDGRLTEIGRSRRQLSETEMELARTKKELAEVKMERDIQKKQLRTLPESRCTVRGNEADAAPLSHSSYEPCSKCISQWFLCLAETTSLRTGKGKDAVGVRDQGSTQANPADLWCGEAAA